MQVFSYRNFTYHTIERENCTLPHMRTTHKNVYKLLTFSILLVSGCENKSPQVQNTVPPPPPTISYSVIKTYPHDTASYTQGLVVESGKLYEGVGNYGRSALRLVDLNTGKSLKQVKLEDRFFGEGIAVLNDTIYQLTWKEKKVFAYERNSFKKLREFDVNFEGWGLTTDGTHLIVSNGSGELFFYQPSDFKLIRTQQITEAGSPSYNLNELEFIRGHIYANQWQQPYILKIDPTTGNVVGKADLTNMWNRIKSLYPNADVPNGIAFDRDAEKIYVTGKWWPELYEIQFSN